MNPRLQRAERAGSPRHQKALEWQVRNRQTMAETLVAESDAPNLPQALALIEHQRECIVCGYGMIIKTAGAYVPRNERQSWDAIGRDGHRVRITVHARCLTEPSFGRRVSDVLGYTEPER